MSTPLRKYPLLGHREWERHPLLLERPPRRIASDADVVVGVPIIERLCGGMALARVAHLRGQATRLFSCRGMNRLHRSLLFAGTKRLAHDASALAGDSE